MLNVFMLSSETDASY